MEEADVDNRIAEKAKEFGTTKEVLKKKLKEGGGLGRLRDMLFAESTLDFLIEKMGVSRDECRVPREKTKYSRSGVE